MFYKHTNCEPTEIFKNPPSEYRSMPFWAWNCRLDPEELVRQIGIFEEMGFGGFFMHPRSGLDTKYLGEHFFECVKTCVNEAEKRGLYAALYDEDRYSSGPAGGLVTADPALRERVMILVPAETVRTNPSDVILGFYDIELDENGFLKSYSPNGKGWKLISTTENRELAGWWGGDESFIDTLNPKAAEKFTEISHDKYNSAVGEKFQSTCPMIFSDELQHAPTPPLPDSSEKRAVLLWSPGLFDEFEKRCGYRLEACLPEVIWNRPVGDRQVRYDYHRVISELFCENYVKVLASWCRKHSLPFTGHMSGEETLYSEILRGGDIFACLGEFDIPGVDVLGRTNGCPLTLLRTRSVARQLGREGMMSELYGVTGWLYSFREYKREGDFQAALGVTLRVPHLAWVSMKGSGKRDYPASIGSQSPWYPKFSLLENHFARISAILTRGKAAAKVAVVHPVESAWILFGPDDQDRQKRDELETSYSALIKKLLCEHIEFDLLSESMLEKTGCDYETVIIPELQRLRESTIDALKSVKKVLTLSKVVRPDFAIPVTAETLIGALEREVSITENGSECGDYVCQHRIENGSHWLFAAPFARAEQSVPGARDIEFSLLGEWSVEEFDTLNGEIKRLPAEFKNGFTAVKKRLEADDSLLLRFSPGKPDAISMPDKKRDYEVCNIPDSVPYTLSEPNVLLLDTAEISLDSGAFSERGFLLSKSKKVREICGYPNDLLQPYKRPDLPPEHRVTMRFRFNSEIEAQTELALEYTDGIEISLNGEPVDVLPYGFFADASIRKIKLPRLKTGENLLDITLPFGLKTTLEPFYLLGDFAASVDMTLSKLPEKLSFGDITKQGFPFYSGNITYHLPDFGRVRVTVNAAAVYAEVNGQPLCFAPFSAETEGALDIVVMPGRHNTFGALHCRNNTSGDPGSFCPKGDSFSDAPLTVPRGLLEKPLVERW